jgi:hypothetical protein
MNPDRLALSLGGRHGLPAGAAERDWGAIDMIPDRI